MAMHARPQAETSHSDLPDLREAPAEARAQAALLWPDILVLVLLVVEKGTPPVYSLTSITRMNRFLRSDHLVTLEIPTCRPEVVYTQIC